MSEVNFAEVISKIAHELRSPLTSIKGFSATLVGRWDRFTDEQRLQFVETIHQDAQRMARIISEVLDLARLESGRLELHRIDADIGATVAKAVENVAELPGAEWVEVEIPEGSSVWADPERLEHVLTNLLENAVKFSDEGPIRVTSADERDGWIEIAVSDAGIGIESDRFDELFSAPGPTREGRSVPRGAGLGLYLSRRLIEAHGGTISLVSELGRGSTFTVRLPAEPEPAGGPE